MQGLFKLFGKSKNINDCHFLGKCGNRKLLNC